MLKGYLIVANKKGRKEVLRFVRTWGEVKQFVSEYYDRHPRRWDRFCEATSGITGERSVL